MASILVIDDNYDMLEMLRIALEHKGGHEVFLSAEGKDGLASAKTKQPDIAIVDVMMPGMNGYEVVRQLRADPNTENMGIIILTARGQSVDEAAALQAGADLYMAKPVKPNDLLDEVNNLLNTSMQKSDDQVESGFFPIFSLRGGVGATTLATNIALLLQQINTSTLIDLSLNSGHCAPCLRLQPKRHWGILLNQIPADKLALAINSMIMKHPSGLQLLAAPPKPLTVEEFSSLQLLAILDVIQKKSQFVVVDSPPVLSSANELILERATKIILLSGSDILSIQSTHAALTLLQRYRDRLVLVVNNVLPGHQAPLDKLEKHLKLPVTAQIPYYEDVVANKSKGMPAVLSQPKSEFVGALQKVAQALLAKEPEVK